MSEFSPVQGPKRPLQQQPQQNYQFKQQATAFADLHPQDSVQLQRQKLANESPRNLIQQQMQDLADNSQKAMQLKAIRALSQGSQRAQDHMSSANAGQPVQRVHIGKEPDVPNTYRLRTTRTGSTRAHYGGGPMNIHAGVYNSNTAGGMAGVVLAAPQFSAISDHSGNGLLDRNWASNNEPQIDHIVPAVDHGSNSYSNARVLSTTENNGGVAVNRPGAGNIVTRAHQNIRIQDGAGYDHTTAQNGQLDANDLLRIATFGGTGPAITAASGTTANGVTLTEW